MITHSIPDGEAAPKNASAGQAPECPAPVNQGRHGPFRVPLCVAARRQRAGVNSGVVPRVLRAERDAGIDTPPLGVEPQRIVGHETVHDAPGSRAPDTPGACPAEAFLDTLSPSGMLWVIIRCLTVKIAAAGVPTLKEMVEGWAPRADDLPWSPPRHWSPEPKQRGGPVRPFCTDHPTFNCRRPAAASRPPCTAWTHHARSVACPCAS